MTRDPVRGAGVRRSPARWRRATARALALLGVAGCGGVAPRGEPLADPASVAESAREATSVAGPTRVVFEWEYADERGNLRGEGAARINPPDRFRLDLFSTGEGSLVAVLVDGRLATSGDLEDVDLPPPPLLYAMAGVFRPGAAAPASGFRSGDLEVLAYPSAGAEVRYYYFESGRLVRVEDREGARLRRRIEIAWGTDPTWPREARYRDDVTPTRVRWELERTVAREEAWDDEVFSIPRG